MKHVSIRVFGRVQGVAFRACTRERALKLGLCGYVKNMPDTSVFLEAEGPEDQVAQLVEWVRQGPPAASVSDMQVNYSDCPRKYQDFEIRF